MNGSEIGQVLSSAPNSIIVEVVNLKTFEENKEHFQIGRYLKIAQGNKDFVVAMIKNVQGIKKQKEAEPTQIDWQFLIECQAIGTLVEGKTFERGTVGLPVPTEFAYIADEDILNKIFVSDESHNFILGKLSLNKTVDLNVDGDKFFGKHLAVVGSTGSGKSCSVARIIQRVVGINAKAYQFKGKQNNSHFIIFDIHSEYRAAFDLEKTENFTLNVLDIDSLKLPYWLMNSEELESMFIESNEANSHNQVSQFKKAVILNKEAHNPGIKEMTYDNPVYFSLQEVHNYIENMNREVVSKLENENCPKLTDGTLVKNREDYYFTKILDFVVTSQAKADKASNGPFNGEFNRFVSRLETRMTDKRLKFLMDPRKKDGKEFATADFPEIVKQFLGYIDKSNITIIDLSGVPFEVLSVVISLISRIVFDFCFHYSKLQHANSELNNVPFMVVCEEAHNYVPQDNNASYASSRKSIERIAKEGRKYGLSLMVVSQRPSEVSETIFAQCNNFVALRLTNDKDQAYIRNLLPDNSNAITEVLPTLGPGECIVVGDATLLPAIVQIEKPNPQPQSESVEVLTRWREDWKDIAIDSVVRRWRKE